MQFGGSCCIPLMEMTQRLMCKNNSRNSSKFKGCSPLQFSCNLIGMKPAIAYYSYTKRLCVISHIKKTQLNKKKYRDYGKVDLEDHETEIREEQAEKDTKAFGVEIK